LNESDIYREWAPPAGWEVAVSCCWEQRVGATRVQRVLPDGCADLISYDSGRVEVVGLYDQVAQPTLAAGAHLRGIRFRPAAVAAAFGTPASLLCNQTLPADSVLGSKFTRRLTDPYWVDTWVRSVKPDPRMSAAVCLLAARSVHETARALDITARHLQRLVLAEVGLSPKTYQEIVRLRRFLDAIDTGAALAPAAASAGYADQAHLTRDIRRFCGLTPARLATERHSA
jgi:AraC-like DNA-binding protein